MPIKAVCIPIKAVCAPTVSSSALVDKTRSSILRPLKRVRMCAGVGERGPDGDFLLRGGPGDQARVRVWHAEVHQAVHPALHGRPRGHPLPDGHLRGDPKVHGGRHHGGVGHPHGDGHRVCVRHLWLLQQEDAPQRLRLPAYARHRRRPGETPVPVRAKR
eukprot:8196905-Pyramimonas_sp.AAC.1